MFSSLLIALAYSELKKQLPHNDCVTIQALAFIGEKPLASIQLLIDLSSIVVSPRAESVA
eukprot:1355178-Amphidinium_carterae.2